jgi:hypothetical protein
MLALYGAREVGENRSDLEEQGDSNTRHEDMMVKLFVDLTVDRTLKTRC